MFLMRHITKLSLMFLLFFGFGFGVFLFCFVGCIVFCLALCLEYVQNFLNETHHKASPVCKAATAHAALVCHVSP